MAVKHQDMFNEHTNLVGINTKGTKFFLTRPENGHHPMRTIKAVPEQVLPAELQGAFSDVACAKKAFEIYMSRVNRTGKKKVAEKKDAAEVEETVEEKVEEKIEDEVEEKLED